MKRLLTTIAFTLIVYLTHAVDITQFYAGSAARNLNIIVWTVYDEQDITGYIVEKDGVEVWTEQSGDFWSAGYYFYDPAGIKWFTRYDLKVVFPDGHTELRATAYAIASWWRWWGPAKSFY